MSSSFTLKLITTPHYHLWNDALHARALAYQTQDNWNRGTYVRWAVMTAWIVLELNCREALQDDNIGFKFKWDMDTAVAKMSLSALDWTNGIWKQVTDIKNTRNTYTHANLTQNELFADVKIADLAISIVRDATKSIYNHVGLNAPVWVDDDSDNGWK